MPPFPGVGWGAAGHRQWAQMSKPGPGRSGMTGIKKTLPQGLGQLQLHLAHCLLFANKALLTAAPTCVCVSYGRSCHGAAERSSRHGDPPACRAGDAHPRAPTSSAWQPRRPPSRASPHFCSSLAALWLCCSVSRSCLPLL